MVYLQKLLDVIKYVYYSILPEYILNIAENYTFYHN